MNRILHLSVFAVLALGVASAGGPGFRSHHMLEEHYAKYGSGFGAVTQEQYLHMAQQLRDSRPSKAVLETKRSDGSGAKFDRRRGWFVAYEPDRTIKMFLVPKEGLRYFQWQATKRPAQK